MKPRPMIRPAFVTPEWRFTATPLALALGLLLVMLSQMPLLGRAQARPMGLVAANSVTAQAAPTPTAPDVPPSFAPPAGTEEPEPRPAPGIPSDATSVSVELPPRPVALVSGKAEWTNGFKSIVGAIAKVKGAIAGAGLTQAGRPFVVFLATDDTNFEYEAMVPIAGEPKGKAELAGGVKIGRSPPGKAIKFLHRGAYDDIDSTYDLITAFLDEKGLEAQNLFIEEYLTDTTEPDDPNLEADIYVLLK